MNKLELIKRIYKTQIKKYIPDFLIVFIFMIITGASTAAVAWLLDPAIKKIFVEKDSTMLVIIPVGIIFAFLAKSISLYITRVKSIDISFKIKQSIQINLAEKILNSKILLSLGNDSSVIGLALGTVLDARGWTVTVREIKGSYVGIC
ncbi:MAG: hypothetical protein VW911_01820, partial [Pelagibacteraceae bacterium]